MTSANTYQHWVPAFYLARFSSEPDKVRQAPLYVAGAEGTFVSTAGKLARGRDFYTKAGGGGPVSATDRPREALIHGQLEDQFRSALSGAEPGAPATTLVHLMLCAVTLHVRSPIIENATDTLRLDVIQRNAVDFFHGLVLCGSSEIENSGRTKDVVAGRALDEWQHSILEAGEEAAELIISDAPCVIVDDESGTTKFLALPLSPHRIYVASRKTHFRAIGSEYTARDAERLNGLLTARCVRHVYQRSPFDPDDLASIQRILTRRPIQSEIRDVMAPGRRIGRRPFVPVGAVDLSFLKPESGGQ